MNYDVPVTKFHTESMTKIWDRLYLGCMWDAAQLKLDNQLGISYVVNCTHDKINYTGKKIDSYVLGFHDGFELDEAIFWRAMEKIREVMDANKTVLVHCHAGISRSTTIVAAYMYLCGYESLDVCLEIIRASRPIVQPAPALWKSVKQHLKIWPYDGTYIETKT